MLLLSMLFILSMSNVSMAERTYGIPNEEEIIEKKVEEARKIQAFNSRCKRYFELLPDTSTIKITCAYEDSDKMSNDCKELASILYRTHQSAQKKSIDCWFDLLQDSRPYIQNIAEKKNLSPQKTREEFKLFADAISNINIITALTDEKK